MTQRSITLGIKVSQETTITVTLPEEDTSTEAKIYTGTKPDESLSRSGATYTMTVPTGEYLLMVDSTLRPSSSDPFTVTTSTSALFWSAVHPDPGSGPRAWESGTGATVSVVDPKDPWPLLTAPTSLSGAFIASTSAVATEMGNQLTTNVGRGAA